MAIFNTVYGGEGKWKPGANTLAYFPLAEDGLDVMGNYTLSNTGTQQTLGRLFTAQSILSSAPSSTNATTLVWAYLNAKDAPSSSNYCQMLRCLCYNSCMYVSGTSAPAPCFSIYVSPSDYPGGSNLLTTGQWYLIAITKSKSGSTTTLKGYVNGTEYQFYSGTAPSDVADTAALIYANGTVNMVLSNFIIENKARTEQEISDYYNQTKGNYGL